MARRKVLPTIEAHYDSDGITFFCDDEVIEDLEMSWDDLEDPELVAEMADELVEYIDADDLVNVDNPAGTVRKVLRQLRRTQVARRATGDEDEDDGFDPDDGSADDLDDDYDD
ncbi:MAG TPA: hypothetical protein VK997_08740 [Deferrisomatales bacterium]|nr:hypothetical protein [Deferrisomatales bacterium]